MKKEQVFIKAVSPAPVSQPGKIVFSKVKVGRKPSQMRGAFNIHLLVTGRFLLFAH